MDNIKAWKLKKIITVFLSLFLVIFISSCKKNPITQNLEDLTRPVIWLNTFEMTFAASEVGGNPSAQSLQTKNSGVNTLNYTLSAEDAWINIEPISGTSSNQVNEHTISIDKTGLAARDEPYTGTITISSSEAYNNPQKVTVQLSISKEPPPQIRVSPVQLSFSAQTGGANPSRQKIQVQNIGGGTLNFKAEPDSSWITVNPSQGSSTDEEKSIRVSIDINGLDAGTHRGLVKIIDPAATNSPQEVKVTLRLTDEPKPTISIDPTKISFSGRKGESNPAAQFLFISNTGGGTLKYTIDWDAAWLSVNPNSGQTKENQKKHTVEVDTTGLDDGTYNGTIDISDPNASNGPQSVNVTLTITTTPPPPPPSTNNTVGVYITPGSAQTGDTITVYISLDGNTSEISAFGLQLHFDTNMFTFQSASSGGLTGSWGFLGGHEPTPGTLIIGGARLSGNPIPIGSVGDMVLITLQVTGGSSPSGTTTQISIDSFSDDIRNMTISPANATFTFLI